jgi:hypothetical protein
MILPAPATVARKLRAFLVSTALFRHNPSMRFSHFLLLFGLLVSAMRAEVELIRVWPGYRTAESFVGIREYFGGEEQTSGRLILRSQPAARAGYYWLVRVRSAIAVPEAQLELQVVRAGNPDPETHRFPCSLKTGSQPILAGLTGGDWPDAQARPTAWQVRLLDPSGETLVSETSFLWSTSAAPAAP